MKGRLCYLIVLFFFAFGDHALSTASAEELAIAAASALNWAMKEVTAKFEAASGAKVHLSIGSSGNLYSQIRNDAAFDLYFSSDIGYPKKLEEAGMTLPGTLYQYAVGRIVLWAPKTSQLDVEKGLDLLRNSGIGKVAIPNPKHAPYGRAAVSALNHFQVYDAVKDRLVFAENTSQAAKFVESGAADVGIIALSLALSPNMKAAGRYWEVPSEAHPAIEQGAVILKESKNQHLAKQFLEFVRGNEGQEIMQRYGFTLPK
ncbi:MAG TPA: molybdate ABC transporter substrate-binding protein [Nitrospiraceae bacterium]|nr:molybdate ABC transporter substrate-binding protein [Nitrospiraceae bacterium]